MRWMGKNQTILFLLGRSAKHITSHVTGTSPWRCLAAQSGSGTSQTASALMRGMRAQRHQGRTRGSVTTMPCCIPCSSWPLCLETCWCVWLCWGNAPFRPRPTTWWSAWLWPTCWWLRWSCPGLSTWRWVGHSVCAYSFIIEGWLKVVAGLVWHTPV